MNLNPNPNPSPNLMQLHLDVSRHLGLGASQLRHKVPLHTLLSCCDPTLTLTLTLVLTLTLTPTLTVTPTLDYPYLGDARRGAD